MFAKLKYLVGSSPTRPVFVIGTGRSGTHWLGYSLGNHPEVRATVEMRPMFGLSTRMALDASLESQLFGKLRRAYQWQLLRSAPRLYLDKSHPNIWIAEKLKDAFPKSQFVAIERNPYATVASMMKHRGVAAWHKRWREFPIPNRFLGITEDIASEYESIPFASQCAMRWLAHRDRLDGLRTSLGDSLFVISYESFASDTEKIIADLQRFLNLCTSIPIPDVKTDSLHKWKKQLSDDEIDQIEDIVRIPPTDFEDTLA
jgi:hypothetical protein